MKNPKKLFYILPFFAVLFLVGVFAFTQDNSKVPNNVEDSIGYKASVQVFTTGDFEGRETEPHIDELEYLGESSNVLYHTGREGIEGLIGGADGADAFDWIEMGNASTDAETPLADKSEGYTPYGAVCGMDVVAGDYDTLGGNGNWTISTTFTATCDDVLTNVTRLQNAGGDDLAGNEFTLVTLQTSDTLLINWSVWVEY